MKRHFTIRALLVAMSIIAGVVALASIQPWKDPRFRPAATRKYEHYCNSLVAELTLPDQDQNDCGTYVSINDENSARSIAFGAKHWVYEFRRFHHGTPDEYDRTFGLLHRENGTIFLAPEFESSSLPRVLHVICWGNRKYLMATTDLDDFRNAIDTGVEPRTKIEGRFLLRIGDEQKTVSGEPVMPDQARKT